MHESNPLLMTLAVTPIMIVQLFRKLMLMNKIHFVSIATNALVNTVVLLNMNLLNAKTVKVGFSSNVLASSVPNTIVVLKELVSTCVRNVNVAAANATVAANVKMINLKVVELDVVVFVVEELDVVVDATKNYFFETNIFFNFLTKKI